MYLKCILGSTINPGSARKVASAELRLRITHIRIVSTHPISKVFELAHRKLQRKFSRRELKFIYGSVFKLKLICIFN